MFFSQTVQHFFVLDEFSIDNGDNLGQRQVDYGDKRSANLLVMLDIGLQNRFLATHTVPENLSDRLVLTQIASILALVGWQSDHPAFLQFNGLELRLFLFN